MSPLPSYDLNSGLSINTPGDFANALLSALGAPVTPVNLQSITGWAAEEGGNWHNTAAYNPLNTTLRVPGHSTILPGGGAAAAAGVQAYDSWSTGVGATASTIQESAYSRVLADLKASAPSSQVAADVAASPWGTGNWVQAGVKGTAATGTATLTSGTPNPATAGGGQAGAPYTPSVIPGVPATPPSLPDFTLNPVNEIGRVITWTTEFGAWSLFIIAVLSIGLALMFIGALLLAVVLLGPIWKPAARVVGGRSPVGRLVSRGTSAARSRPDADDRNYLANRPEPGQRARMERAKRGTSVPARPRDTAPVRPHHRKVLTDADAY